MRRATGALLTCVVVAALATACSSSGGGPGLGPVTGAGSVGAGTTVSAGTTTHPAGTVTTPKSTAGRKSSVPQTNAGARNVCALMSAAEASKLNNVPYKGATPRHIAAGFDSCSYDNAGHAPDPIDIQDLDVSVITAPDCFAQLKASTDGAGRTAAVSGVGDQAIGYGIGLLVRSGNTCVELQGLTHAEFNSNWAPDVAMAKLVLGRLH